MFQNLVSFTKYPDDFNMKVCDEVIERVQVFTYLGFHR